MNDDLKNILSNLNKDIEQEKLLQYLNQKMSEAEQHEFEKQMNDDEFMNDAIEGLQQVHDKNEIPAYIQQINSDLKKQLTRKKKEKRKLPSLFWTYISIILLLALIVVAYVVIKKMGHT